VVALVALFSAEAVPCALRLNSPTSCKRLGCMKGAPSIPPRCRCGASVGDTASDFIPHRESGFAAAVMARFVQAFLHGSGFVQVDASRPVCAATEYLVVVQNSPMR
jgi:hypothetical protein